MKSDPIFSMQVWVYAETLGTFKDRRLHSRVGVENEENLIDGDLLTGREYLRSGVPRAVNAMITSLDA